MFKTKSKKFLLILLTTLSITFSQNSYAKNNTVLNRVRALTILTKVAFTIAANVQELRENELAALKLETTYLCLDIADTTLKMVDDFKSVSLLEEAVGIYHLVKIFQNIHAINLKKSAEQKKNNSPNAPNIEDTEKQKKVAKKIIYSIIKYFALATEAGSSILFNSPIEDDRIFSSNISGFAKLLADLIDNATPQVRSKALLLLAPVALATSFTIAKNQQENREQEKKEAEDKKRKEEEKHMEEELRKEREKQEREEAERKQKQWQQEEKERQEKEKRVWDSLSDEEKKQEQERRQRKEKQEDDERRFDDNFRTNQRQKKGKFWENIKEKWEKLKKEKGQERFSNFPYYNRGFESHQDPFGNQFGFRNSFNSFNNPFNSYQNPFNSFRSPFDTYQSPSDSYRNSFGSYRSPFDSYQDPFDTLHPEFSLDNSLFKIGSKYLSDEENKEFWNNVKEQWNNFEEQQGQDELRYQEQLREREEAYQREENRIKRDNTNNLTFSKIQNEDKEECVICQDSFQTGEAIGILSCNGKHFYHQSCIRSWLETDPRSSCPLCRQENVVISENITLKKTQEKTK